LITAVLSVRFTDSKTAKTIDEALAPDNVKLPKGMKIYQVQRGRILRIEVSIQGNRAVETLTSTLDEFVSHIQVAVGALGKTMRQAE
jgi:hypothetical protein